MVDYVDASESEEEWSSTSISLPSKSDDSRAPLGQGPHFARLKIGVGPVDCSIVA